MRSKLLQTFMLTCILTCALGTTSASAQDYHLSPMAIERAAVLKAERSVFELDESVSRLHLDFSQIPQSLSPVERLEAAVTGADLYNGGSLSAQQARGAMDVHRAAFASALAESGAEIIERIFPPSPPGIVTSDLMIVYRIQFATQQARDSFVTSAATLPGVLAVHRHSTREDVDVR